MKKIQPFFLSLIFVFGLSLTSNLEASEMDKKPVARTLFNADGGGVRVMATLTMIEYLEEKLDGKFIEYVDIGAGSSAGGLANLILNYTGDGEVPIYTATQAKKLCRENMPTIFSRSFGHKLKSVWGFWGSMYPDTGREQIGLDIFKDAKMCQTYTNTMVSAYQIADTQDEGVEQPYFFKSYKAQGCMLGEHEQKESRDCFMRDVASATGAAPIYFPPKQVQFIDGSRHWFIDGGVQANRPELPLFVEAKRLFPKTKDFCFLSFGTGDIKKKISRVSVGRGGVLGWGLDLITAFMNGNSRTSGYVANRVSLLMNADLGYDIHYCRFNPPLSIACSSMDNATPGNFDALERETLNYLRTGTMEYRGETKKVDEIMTFAAEELKKTGKIKEKPKSYIFDDL